MKKFIFFFAKQTVAIAAFVALGFAIASYYYAQKALWQPTGFGSSFTETSPQVNLTQAPGVSSLFVIFGCSIFPANYGFGSMSGTVTVNVVGPQIIRIQGPFSSIIGKPSTIGAIPGLMILAVDNSNEFLSAQFDIAPTQYDVTLTIANATTTGTFSFTQPFIGISVT